jgi:hypothetical protein
MQAKELHGHISDVGDTGEASLEVGGKRPPEWVELETDRFSHRFTS